MNLLNRNALLLVGLCCTAFSNLSAAASPSLTLTATGLNQASPMLSSSSASLSQGLLAQLLAPIALYPDTVLTHVLISATYPLDVVQAERWHSQRQGMSQNALMSSAEAEPWDPSIKALLAFPSLLQKMSQDLAWTQALGDAFIQDEARVLDAIQVLRQQAYDADNLNELQNMRVRRVEKHIIIEPVQTQVIYLPYYDSRYIYGNWHWQQHPPHYWHRPAYISSSRYIAGPSHRAHIYWDTGVHIGVNFFFSAFHWHKRHVVVTSHHNSHYYQRPQQIFISKGAKHWHHNNNHNSNHRANHRSSVSHGDGGLPRRHSTSVGAHGSQYQHSNSQGRQNHNMAAPRSVSKERFERTHSDLQQNHHQKAPSRQQITHDKSSFKQPASSKHESRSQASQYDKGSPYEKRTQHALRQADRSQQSHSNDKLGRDNRAQVTHKPVQAIKTRDHAEPVRKQQDRGSNQMQRSNREHTSNERRSDREHSGNERRSDRERR